jgi:hypothetical protein
MGGDSIRILLGDYLWIKEPGVYTVRCTAKFPVVDSSGSPIVSNASGLIRFTIRQDEEELARIVASLGARLRASGTREDAVWQVLVVHHPLVLPHLGSLLNDPDEAVASSAVDAIKSIGGAEARRILTAYESSGTKQPKVPRRMEQASSETNRSRSWIQKEHGTILYGGTAFLSTNDAATNDLATATTESEKTQARLSATRMVLDVRQHMSFEDMIGVLAVKGRCDIVLDERVLSDGFPGEGLLVTGAIHRMAMGRDSSGMWVTVTARDISLLELLRTVAETAGATCLVKDGRVWISPKGDALHTGAEHF